MGSLVNTLIALLAAASAYALTRSWTPAEGRATRALAALVIPATIVLLWGLAALILTGLLAAAEAGLQPR